MTKTVFHLNEIAFANHMETKAKILDPEEVFIGVDFCVMIFRYPYQCRSACHALLASNENYNYILEEKENKVMIYNQHYYDKQE